jgi:multicomponent Na+:H+ antiporter subunit E
MISRGAIKNICLFTLIWILLNEKLNGFVVLSGIFFSVISLYFTDKVLLGKSYSQLFHIPFTTILAYLIYLIFQIFKSGLTAIPKVIKGDCRVKIVDYHTPLNSQVAISLLANAITLTHGTITIEKKGNILSILCFDDEEIIDDPELTTTFSKYEQILGSLKS